MRSLIDLKKIFFWTLPILLFWADFSLKKWVVSALPHLYTGGMLYPFGGINIFSPQGVEGLRAALVFTTNKGAAWSLFSNYPELLFWVRSVLVLFLSGYILYLWKEGRSYGGLLFVLWGAIGNILDLFLYGKVVDMFYIAWGVYVFPVFNIADIMITIGVVWFFLESILEKKRV